LKSQKTDPDPETDAVDSSGPSFADLGAHPVLAVALTAREYTTPTPVQAAVLGAPEKDLLVSAQTGSGKTVAFGLVLGRVLLGDASKLAPAASGKPRALVIAPTRELAAQVQRELGWLLAGTGARLATFTGGTSLTPDTRALHRGVDIAVGTPGRLQDLVDRGALDLAALEIIVLDEADEMLDLGFRDAIEALLGAAPAERRTLLFSATLPPAIRGLARKFQRDALPLDPRAGQAPHADIEHVAVLCANGERLPALVNMLHVWDDDRIMVFCRTRDGVAELHEQLITRGVLAAAISGDREQADRTRALEALRSRRVRVLVATNVAARGLDLPDLGRVVHADLPDNAEALTHRSGRTGRAGKKGVSLYLVESGVRRRAERLFQAARLKVKWTPVVTEAQVAAHQRAQLQRELEAAAAGSPTAAAHALAEELLGHAQPTAIVAALIDRALAGQATGEKVTNLPVTPLAPQKLPGRPLPRTPYPTYGDAPPPARPPRPGPPGRGTDYALFQVNLGAKDNAQVNWILPLICRRGGVTRKEIGAIRVAADRTFVEVDRRIADDFAASAGERDPRAPHVRIEPADAPLPERSHAPVPFKPGFKPGGKPFTPGKRPAGPGHPASHKKPDHKKRKSF
jgi:ATP-dependent RNA helicase DeaD